MLKHSGGVISDFKMSSDTEAGTNMDRGKNGVMQVDHHLCCRHQIDLPAEIGGVPVRRHGGIGEQTRGKHQRVLQMGVVGGTIYGLKRKLPVKEIRIGDQAGGKNGLHIQLPIQQGVFCLLLQDHQQNGLELTRVGIGDQAGDKNSQHHQLRIQQEVFRLLLEDHQQNGLELTRVGIGDQAGDKNGQHHQLPIQQGVFRLLLHDHQQNGLEVTRVGIGDQAGGKNGLHHQLPILHDHHQNGLEVTRVGIGDQAGGKNGLHHQLLIRPQAEWSRSDEGRNWGSSSWQKVPAPVSNSGGSFPPPHSQPSAEQSRSHGWNWEARSGQKMPAPVSNSGGSFPPPHSQPSAEQSRSHIGIGKQAVGKKCTFQFIQRANRDERLSVFFSALLASVHAKVDTEVD